MLVVEVRRGIGAVVKDDSNWNLLDSAWQRRRPLPRT